MWIITPNGFWSAVQHRTDPDMIVARTRVKADALHLAQFVLDVEPLNHDDYPRPEDLLTTYRASDYPWRVILRRDTWQSFLATEAHQDHLDYGNVKDAVKARQGAERADTYMAVWATLLRLQDQDPDTPQRSIWADPATENWDDDLDLDLAIAGQREGWPALDASDYAWTVTLECGCIVNMDDERLVTPCANHAEPPF